MADATIWGAIAGLLSVFEFSRTMDESGKEIDIQPLFGGSIIRLVPFVKKLLPLLTMYAVIVSATHSLSSAP